MCRFTVVQQSLGNNLHSPLPTLLDKLASGNGSTEDMHGVLDVCVLISLLPVASSNVDEMYGNVLGILTTLKVQIVHLINDQSLNTAVVCSICLWKDGLARALHLDFWHAVQWISLFQLFHRSPLIFRHQMTHG